MIDTATRAALDRHMIAALAILYRTIPGGTFEIMPDWVRGYSGLPWPNYNIFLPLKPIALSDDSLADADAFFTAQEVRYAIELIHDRFPEGLEFLGRRRYESLPPQPAMILQDFPVNPPINLKVEIEPVRTVPALTAFYTTLERVFDFPVADAAKLYPVIHVKNEVIYHYLAFLDEQPVGVGTIICVEDVASIWNLCTLDSYRRQGVATTLLHAMLSEAQRNYCRVAMLYATPHAFHMFSHFGFEIYTQRQWFLPPGVDYMGE